MTSDTMKVDWAQPLEAVHEDGIVANAMLKPGSRKDFREVCYMTEHNVFVDRFLDNGKPKVSGHHLKWTIRNKPAAAVAPEAPETPAEAPLGVLTGVERLERLEALCARLAALPFCNAHDEVAEARALMAEIAPPIDPDLLKAREIVASLYEAGDNVSAEHRESWARHCRDGAYDDGLDVRAALAGIKAGREMGE